MTYWKRFGRCAGLPKRPPIWREMAVGRSWRSSNQKASRQTDGCCPGTSTNRRAAHRMEWLPNKPTANQREFPQIKKIPHQFPPFLKNYTGIPSDVPFSKPIPSIFYPKGIKSFNLFRYKDQHHQRTSQAFFCLFLSFVIF